MLMFHARSPPSATDTATTHCSHVRRGTTPGNAFHHRFQVLGTAKRLMRPKVTPRNSGASGRPLYAPMHSTMLTADVSSANARMRSMGTLQQPANSRGRRDEALSPPCAPLPATSMAPRLETGLGRSHVDARVPVHPS